MDIFISYATNYVSSLYVTENSFYEFTTTCLLMKAVVIPDPFGNKITK